MPVLTTVVSKRRWLRGGSGASALLLRRKMCCLGFRARAAGAKPKDIDGVGCPQYLSEPSKFFSRKFCVEHSYGYRLDTELCQKMMTVNDDPDINDTVRMKKLKELFRKAGERIRFVD